MNNYLKLVFSKLDKSQNGTVSAFELKIFISRMNMPHVDDFVEELDSKGDSQFTLEEFVNLYLEMLARVNIIMFANMEFQVWWSIVNTFVVLVMDHPYITSTKRWVGGVRKIGKMAFFVDFQYYLY